MAQRSKVGWGYSIILTKEQRRSLHELWVRVSKSLMDRGEPIVTFREFRRRFHKGCGSDPMIGGFVKETGMYYGIEEDGYTHT